MDKVDVADTTAVPLQWEPRPGSIEEFLITHAGCLIQDVLENADEPAVRLEVDDNPTVTRTGRCHRCEWSTPLADAPDDPAAFDGVTRTIGELYADLLVGPDGEADMVLLEVLGFRLDSVLWTAGARYLARASWRRPSVSWN